MMILVISAFMDAQVKAFILLNTNANTNAKNILECL